MLIPDVSTTPADPKKFNGAQADGIMNKRAIPQRILWRDIIIGPSS
jgi:hypothetical protein